MIPKMKRMSKQEGKMPNSSNKIVIQTKDKTIICTKI